MTDDPKVSRSPEQGAGKVIVPSIFVASIGGFFDGSFEVNWTEGRLVYRRYHGDKEQKEILTPTAKQWQNFKTKLDEINVWAWQTRYEQPVLDGTGWSLHVKWGDRVIESSGSNGYPTTTGALSKAFDPTPAFRKYLKAVSQLLGGKTFR